MWCALVGPGSSEHVPSALSESAKWSLTLQLELNLCWCWLNCFLSLLLVSWRIHVLGKTMCLEQAVFAVLMVLNSDIFSGKLDAGLTLLIAIPVFKYLIIRELAVLSFLNHKRDFPQTLMAVWIQIQTLPYFKGV